MLYWNRLEIVQPVFHASLFIFHAVPSSALKCPFLWLLIDQHTPLSSPEGTVSSSGDRMAACSASMPCPWQCSPHFQIPSGLPCLGCLRPPAAPTDGLELMRHKAWDGFLCPKLPLRAPGKRHQPIRAYRDPKKHQGQTGQCLPCASL